MKAEDIIIGQECICPDGLGRVKSFTGRKNVMSIVVETYINNRDCDWGCHNVELIDPRRNNYLKEVTKTVGDASITEKTSVPTMKIFENEKPTEDGWYWYLCHKNGKPKPLLWSCKSKIFYEYDNGRHSFIPPYAYLKIEEPQI